MKRITLAVILAAFAATAAAHNCPNLRADGEKLHNDGKHSESMATLGKAKKMLGI